MSIERPLIIESGIFFDTDYVPSRSTLEVSPGHELKTDPQIERFLAFLAERGKSENTISAYHADLIQLCVALRPIMPRPERTIGMAKSLEISEQYIDWSKVTLADLKEFVTGLRNNGYAEATVARKVAAVKSFFHWMNSEGIIAKDPTKYVDSPKVNRALPRTLTAGEVESLISLPRRKEYPEAVRDGAALRLLYATGMRVSELLRLKVDDIDLASGYVLCGDSEHHGRQIPIDRGTAELMETYLSSSRRLLIRRQNHDVIFVNHRGEPLTRQGLWLIVKAYAKEARLPPTTTVHTLRHSFALHLRQNNAPLRDIQILMGHASVATTKIYDAILKVNGDSKPAVKGSLTRR